MSCLNSIERTSGEEPPFWLEGDDLETSEWMSFAAFTTLTDKENEMKFPDFMEQATSAAHTIDLELQTLRDSVGTQWGKVTRQQLIDVICRKADIISKLAKDVKLTDEENHWQDVERIKQHMEDE